MKLLILLFFMSLSAMGQQTSADVEDTPNPGNTGVNAFEFIKFAEDPTIGDKTYLDIELASAANLIGNAQSLIVRVEVPLSKIVSVGGDVRMQKFENSDEAIEKYSIQEKDGVNGGDFNIFTKIQLLEEKHNLPQVALRLTIKTASGGFREDRQFTDSAGYEFALTAAKTLQENQDALIKRIRGFLEVAFAVWDTQLAQQNDAYKASLGASFETKKLTVDVSALYHKGWLDADLDRYLAARVRARYKIKDGFMLTGEARKGFTPAAPDYYVGAGVRVAVFTGKNKKTKKKTKKSPSGKGEKLLICHADSLTVEINLFDNGNAAQAITSYETGNKSPETFSDSLSDNEKLVMKTGSWSVSLLGDNGKKINLFVVEEKTGHVSIDGNLQAMTCSKL